MTSPRFVYVMKFIPLIQKLYQLLAQSCPDGFSMTSLKPGELNWLVWSLLNCRDCL